MKTKLILLFIIAFIIRLIALNQSLWLDEATTANVIRSFSYFDIITKFSPTDFHPPLYYLFLKFWVNLFGYSEIVLRIPSVIFSLLTGFVVYKIGKLMKNETVGIWSAIFFLFNPLVVYYSQEARMYMMVTFLLTVGLYFYLHLFNCHSCESRNPEKTGSLVKPGMTKELIQNLSIFNLFLVLSFYTFYGSIFFIATLFIYLLMQKRYKLFFISLLTFNFALLIISPLLLQQFAHAKQALALIPNWHLVLGSANLKNLLLIPLKFTSGRISFSPKIIYYMISGIWAIGVIWVVIKGGMKQKKLLFFLLIPVILGLVFSFFTPLLQYFRFLYLISIMSLLLAFGFSFTPPGSTKAHPWGVLGQRIMLVGLIVWSLVYLLNPAFHREDWKSVSQYLNNKTVYMIAASSDPLKYYNPNLEINDLVNLSGKQLNNNEIVVIPYVSEIYGLNYRATLKSLNYELKQEKTFRGLTVEDWAVKKAGN